MAYRINEAIDWMPKTTNDKFKISYELAGISYNYIDKSIEYYNDELGNVKNKRPFEIAEYIRKNNLIKTKGVR